MEKKELAERIVEYASNYHWNLEGWGDNVPEDDDLEKELTGIVTFVFEELDKAREEGSFTIEELEVIRELCNFEYEKYVALDLEDSKAVKEVGILKSILSKLKQ